jgi:hypothetical protein
MKLEDRSERDRPDAPVVEPLESRGEVVRADGESDGNSLVHTAESGRPMRGPGRGLGRGADHREDVDPESVAGQSIQSGQLLRSAIADDVLCSRGETYAVSWRSPPDVSPLGMAVQIIRWLKVTAPP